jgi:rare lipoprotein A
MVTYIFPIIFLLNLKIENLPIKTSVSWYGDWHHGRKTASGEVFNMNKLTCASPVLPFGTKVKITNIKNNKSVIVKVNDRGPYKMNKNGKALRPLQSHPKRDFDLSKAAFDSISSLSSGVIQVTYQILK